MTIENGKLSSATIKHIGERSPGFFWLSYQCRICYRAARGCPALQQYQWSKWIQERRVPKEKEGHTIEKDTQDLPLWLRLVTCQCPC